MTLLSRLSSLAATCLIAVTAAASLCAASPRERLPFDADWRFAFGHPADPARDFFHGTSYFSYLAKAGFGDGPAALDFDDRAWRQLDLPHDWAVEAPFSPDASPSHGFKAVGRGFPERSIGWYRKRFHVPAADLGRRISIEFDGVYRDARVWINGFYLGHQPSGYLGVQYDLTDYLNYDGENVISVRADASMEEGWFYEGAGIYRHVWLLKTEPVHVAPWGTYVTTELTDDHRGATVNIATELRHTGRQPATVSIEQILLNVRHQAVAQVTLPPVDLAPGAHLTVPATLTVPSPELWSTTTPTLYRAVTVVRADGRELDRYETTFGIRTVRFDPDEGFFLNGEPLKLKGVNLHQDHAGVGTAMPDALHTWRFEQLKKIGVNAYRTGHQPPAPELLDACDRLGILVIDESRLMGTNPAQLDELKTVLRRDRNHPCVILWSIGNEEWAIEGNIKGARITATMQDFVQRFEPTRRVTAAISGGWGGTSTVIDVVGYNYINQSDPDQQHAAFPHQPGVGTEETTTQSTRGVFVTDPARAHLAPLKRGDSGGNNEVGWTYYAARPFLAGLFYWTGFDYRGEPTPFGWPAISSQYGLLDTCGFPKDSTSYLQAWWTDQPVLHLAPHWNWAGRDGETINVLCYSNHEVVELLLNGTSLGRQTMPRHGHLEWPVPYTPGRLEARAYDDGQLAQTTIVETTGAPTQLTLTAERPAGATDGRDLVMVTVTALDAAGRPVPTADSLVHFDLNGGTVLGVGNGDPGSHEPDRFLPTDTLITPADWRGRIAPAGTVVPADPSTLAPMHELGRYRAPQPAADERYDLTGTFTLATAIPPDATIDLFLPALGAPATIWLNGRELTGNQSATAAGPHLVLAAAQLRPGLNRIQLLVTPASSGPNRIPERDDLGTLRLRQPAPRPQRALFNGLAQVIVELAPDIKTAHFSAHADGLTSAELDLSAGP